MIYYLNEYYKYWNYPQQFKLTKVDGYWFKFECGHRCTDSVFADLVRVKTGVSVYEDRQLEIESLIYNHY